MATKKRYMDENNVRVLISLIKNEFANYLDDEQIQNAITEAIKGISTLEFKKVDVLPETGETNYIYLVSKEGEDGDYCDEYLWDASASRFELIGNTDVDLSGYVTESDLEALTNEEITEIWNSVMNPSEEVE